jgi:hypothetical protein
MPLTCPKFIDRPVTSTRTPSGHLHRDDDRASHKILLKRQDYFAGRHGGNEAALGHRSWAVRLGVLADEDDRHTTQR